MTFLLVVTTLSMVVAGIMSAIAWRIAAEERRRSEARIAALSAEIHASTAAAPRSVAASGGRRPEVVARGESPRLASVGQHPARSDDDLQIRPVVDHRSSTPDLFSSPQRSGRGGVVVIVAALVVGAVFAVLLIRRGLPHAASPSAASVQGTTAVTTPIATGGSTAPQNSGAVPAAEVPASAPLELVALGHDRDGDRLTVRGIVRNPTGSRTVEQVTAVVFAFNGEGGFVGSGRAIIEQASLRPGGESTFVVTMPEARGVSRYRVSFRSGDRIVPHVDRREPAKVSS
jgi:hypothetical protein